MPNTTSATPDDGTKSTDDIARSDPGISSDMQSRPRVFVLKDSTRAALEAQVSGAKRKENDDVLVDPLSDDDESFQLVSNTRSRPEKRSALFIGNLQPTTSEDKLSQYILNRKINAEHAVVVHNVKVFPIQAWQEHYLCQSDCKQT